MKTFHSILKVIEIVVLVFFIGIMIVVIFDFKNYDQIEVGKKFLFSFHWNDENPFQEVKIDTVKVMGYKDGYVKWEYTDGFTQSAKQRIFIDLIKPLDNK